MLTSPAGEVLAFTACSRDLADGRLTQPVRAIRAAGTHRAALTGVCPVHGRDVCLQTYLSAARVSGWSLQTFLTWRRARRSRAES